MVDKERVSLYISSEMKDFYIAEADKAGISLSGYMGFVLKEYMEERQSLHAMKSFEELSNKFKKEDNVNMTGKDIMKLLSDMYDLVESVECIGGDSIDGKS